MAFLIDLFHAFTVRFGDTEPSGDSPSTPPLNQSLIVSRSPQRPVIAC